MSEFKIWIVQMDDMNALIKVRFTIGFNNQENLS